MCAQNISRDLEDWTRLLPGPLQVLAEAMNALSGSAAILNRQGVIIAVNEAWRRFAAENGYDRPLAGLASSYLRICEEAQGDGEAEARRMAEAIRQVGGGAQKEFRMPYACHSPTQQRWFEVSLRGFEAEGQRYLITVHDNVTALRQAEARLAQQARELARLGVSNGGAEEQRQLRQDRARWARLTPREREVFALVVAGQANKQIAARLRVSIKTVEVHRARIMRKMEAQSLAELTRMAVRIESHRSEGARAG